MVYSPHFYNSSCTFAFVKAYWNSYKGWEIFFLFFQFDYSLAEVFKYTRRECLINSAPFFMLPQSHAYMYGVCVISIFQFSYLVNFEWKFFFNCHLQCCKMQNFSINYSNVVGYFNIYGVNHTFEFSSNFSWWVFFFTICFTVLWTNGIF